MTDHRVSAAPRQATLPTIRLVRRTLGVMAALVLSSACDGRVSGPGSPTAPLPGPAATYTVSGTVSESTSSGLTPVEGVLVRDGNSVRRATTDASGFYSLSGVPGSIIELTALKEYYISTSTQVNVSGDLRVDLQIRQLATQTLSGIVYETIGSDRVAVEGVWVYCDACGSPEGHTSVMTEADGLYSFSWANDGLTALLVNKDGYRVAGAADSGHGGQITVSVRGDTRFDIELVRR